MKFTSELLINSFWLFKKQFKRLRRKTIVRRTTFIENQKEMAQIAMRQERFVQHSMMP